MISLKAKILEQTLITKTTMPDVLTKTQLSMSVQVFSLLKIIIMITSLLSFILL